MRRRAFAVLLVIVMVIAVLPVGVAAEETPTVYIAGEKYTSTSPVEGITVDMSGRILTIENIDIALTIDTTASDAKTFSYSGMDILAGIAIIDDDEWTINVNGENTINIKNYKHNLTTSTKVFGIFSLGNMNIISDSSGSVDIDVTHNGYGEPLIQQTTSAVFSNGVLDINGVTIDATTCSEPVNLTEEFEFINFNFTTGAITAAAGITIESSTITAEDKLPGGTGIVALSENIEIKSSTVTAKTSYSEEGGTSGAAISAFSGKFIMSSGKVIAEATSPSSHGIVGHTGAEITGGELNITGDSFGLYTFNESTVEIENNANIAISNAKIGLMGNNIRIDDTATVDITAQNEGIRVTAGYQQSGVISLKSDNISVVTTEETGRAISIISDANVEISKGAYTGDIEASQNYDIEINISGGSYSEPVNPDYLAEELNIELNSNGVYTYHESVEKVQQIIENSTDKDNMSYIDFTPVDGERPDRENTETTEYVTVTFDPKNGNPATVQRNFSGDAIDAPTAPAREDYIFLGWSADGVTAVTFPYTVTDDITLTALWKQDYSDFYTAMRNYRMQNMYLDFSASAGTGGTISGAGTTKLERGNTITYVINPDEGYEIADVLVDGESVGAVSEYTFENASRKHTIEAVFAEAAPEVLYEDVAETDWFHEAVVYVTGNGIMNGTAENETFAPDMTATRGMLVTMLWRLAGSPAAADGTDFSDVPADAWYAEAVKWASANGIVMGSDGRFSPEDPITREQTAAILHRYTVYAGTDDGTDLPMLPQYICSTWAENDVIWADAAGLFDGIGNDMSDLTTEASRAEIAVMLWHTGTLIGRTAE